MTPIETAICQVIKASGGWPRDQRSLTMVATALSRVARHNYSASWHSVNVDGHRVKHQDYKQWERWS